MNEYRRRVDELAREMCRRRSIDPDALVFNEPLAQARGGYSYMPSHPAAAYYIYNTDAEIAVQVLLPDLWAAYLGRERSGGSGA